MQDVFAKWRKSLTDPVTLVTLVSAIILTAFSGPFGTHDSLALIPRLVFWGASLIVALLLGTFVYWLFRLRMPEDKRIEAEIVSSAAFAVLYGGLMLGWVSVFESYTLAGAPKVSWMTIFLEVAVITTALLAIRIIMVRGMNRQAQNGLPMVQTQTEPDAVPANSEPRLMRRLDDEDKATILWLTSENHFVEVHTVKGHVRLRMRLTDAIDEMEGVRGSCVHRSHWVAYAAIESTEKIGGYWRLNLTNGETVPVSRKYQPLLEEAGILERLAIA